MFPLSNWGEHLAYIVEIFIACIVAEAVLEWYKARKARKLDINCDNCEEAKPLNRTPDKVAYLCRNCMGAYFTEHQGDFTEDQVKKAQRGYRRRKR